MSPPEEVNLHNRCGELLRTSVDITSERRYPLRGRAFESPRRDQRLPPRKTDGPSKGCVLVMVETVFPANVYIDESIQHHGKANLYAVAGYVATFDRWIKLEQEWRQILDLFKSPPFHFTDFMGRHGDFENLNWSDEKRNEYMELLCQTAAEHTITGVGCAIYDVDYKKGLPPELLRMWRDPYYFCVYGMLSLIEGMERKTRLVLPKPLYLLFEERKKFQGAALRMFTEFKEILEQTTSPNANLFAKAEFGVKKDYISLQAADLLVGVVNRRFKEMVFKLPYKMKKPLDRLNRKGHLIVAFPSEPHFRKYVQFLRDGKGVNVPHNPKRRAGI
jgi:hypothetical protein